MYLVGHVVLYVIVNSFVSILDYNTWWGIQLDRYNINLDQMELDGVSQFDLGMDKQKGGSA